MRLFVALDVPEALKHAIDEAVVQPLRPLLPDARWTRPEGRHLTLKFLGEVLDERVPSVADALGSLRPYAPFTASFDRIGGFPNLGRPRVLWAGVGRGSDEMVALASRVDVALARVGLDPEDRPFHPHLTLARFRTPKRLGELPDLGVPDDAFEVSHVVLYRSQLHPHGARYTALERITLSGPRSG